MVTSAQKEFKSGDYLLVRRSLYGSDFRERAPRADFSGCCSADILTIRENPEFISDGYLIYVLYSRRLWDFIVSNSSGGVGLSQAANPIRDNAAIEASTPKRFLSNFIFNSAISGNIT